MRVLVTGGTGFLGNNIIRNALAQGHEVKAVVRSSELPQSLKGLEVIPHRGDICDESTLLEAAADVDAIIHSAAHIHIGWKHLDEALKTNRLGTQNVVRAATERGIRLVHVSTVNTLAMGVRHQPANEDTPGDGQIPCTYVVSKRAAEEVVKNAIRANQVDAVIVHPGFMLGPWDWKPSSGRMIIEFASRWTPVAPSGGCSVCDVRDVASGVLQALQRGKAGRNYILAGENLTYLDLWQRFAKAIGKRPPRWRLGPAVRWSVGTLGDFMSRFQTIENPINSAALRMSSKYQWHDRTRAQQELGYDTRAADESIRDAVAWLREYKYLP
jgi:dihydroflavonol-4-reductase